MYRSCPCTMPQWYWSFPLPWRLDLKTNNLYVTGKFQFHGYWMRSHGIVLLCITLTIFKPPPHCGNLCSCKKLDDGQNQLLVLFSLMQESLDGNWICQIHNHYNGITQLLSFHNPFIPTPSEFVWQFLNGPCAMGFYIYVKIVMMSGISCSCSFQWWKNCWLVTKCDESTTSQLSPPPYAKSIGDGMGSL